MKTRPRGLPASPGDAGRGGQNAAVVLFAGRLGLSGRARRHRDILARAMDGAGFVNYPTEWWHWSYGDRYWALISKADRAVYGPVWPTRTAGSSTDGHGRPLGPIIQVVTARGEAFGSRSTATDARSGYESR
ncbi:M15 family metallopeptidase [Streptomyces sp. LN245]|uniref:M15 family metallopeptidase n=1 Tax=Streptomyces sp. LN245 TaxID=3112975 RepID=UPI00372064E5